MRIAVLFAIVLFGSAIAQAKALRLEDLPAPVQKTVRDNLKGGQIRNIGKENENGVEEYEIETLLNGKSRDIEVDLKGNLLVLEEAVPIDAIPAPAKASILKRVGGGKLSLLETVTRPGQPVVYEAHYRDAKGKGHEVLVKPDGAETKE